MSDTRTKIAAGATLLVLGGLAGVALSAESNRATGAAQTAAPVEVRTQIVHRTVHVIRREKPKRRKPTRATSSPAPIPAVSTPPATARAVTLPAKPQSTAPVRTRTSGASGGSGESDDHGRGDDGGEGRDD